MKNNKLRGIFFFLVMVVFVCGTVQATTLQEAARKALDSSTASVIQGEDGWLFLSEELEHLAAGKFWGDEASAVSRAKKKKYADPKPAIVKYNRQLAEKGIILYLMPVPPKALVYPEKLNKELNAETVAADRALYDAFYKELTAEGVKVIDLLPVLAQKRASTKSPLYCLTDSHFSGGGLELFADAVADILKKTDWYGAIPKETLRVTEKQITITGDLSRMSGKEQATEQLSLKIVTRADGSLLTSDPKSPVILLGDSHTLVFQAGGDLHAKGGGLFDLLSAKLGFAVDLLGVRGSGVTPARINLYQRSKKDSSYLDTKKVLIWCFTARDFTGTGGWREIPVAP